jgi:ABC-type multidrug transport system fused ATPase/permease subunit
VVCRSCDYGSLCDDCAGKSTIIQLLLRFYTPLSGEILVDDVPLHEHDVKHYRRSLGVVTQEPKLFNLSIAENIAYGLDAAPPQADLEAAAREARVDVFANELTDGLHTSVGEWGNRLSGGQKQRVAIARAVIRSSHTKILLLDEVWHPHSYVRMMMCDGDCSQQARWTKCQRPL